MNLILFYVLAGIILISALLVVILKNVFHSALFLVVAFFMIAGLYLTLGAEFLAAVQVLIYVGAITILIIFAIMLTYQIQSKAIRQTNEQVLPAAIISVLFFALAAFALTKTFGKYESVSPNMGYWTAHLKTSELPAENNDASSQAKWNWTINIDDGKSPYIAGGAFTCTDQDVTRSSKQIRRPDPERKGGYVISSSSDFSTMDRVFGKDQTIYIKAWNDLLEYGSVSKAEWVIFSPESGKTITRKLANSNTDTIGRLLMSKFALPFEVVSVLLLASLIGAIVIARKDK